MAVDQQWIAGRIPVSGKSCQMDFTDPQTGQRPDISIRISTMVDAGDIDVIDIQQQAAAGALQNVADKLGFTPIRGGKLQIGRRIFQQ